MFFYHLFVKHNVILVRYGELALKGKFTRATFEKALVRNTKQAFDANNQPVKIVRTQGRIFVTPESIDKGVEIITHIFGVTSCSPAFQFDLDVKSISKHAFSLISEVISEGQSFALRVSRSGSHSFSSQDIAIKVGSYVQSKMNVPVNLTNPDFEVFIEIRDDQVYIFTKKFLGPGGMPLGTQGSILSIVESPKDLLASWYLMKRGCKFVFLFSNERLRNNSSSFFSQWFVPRSTSCFVVESDLLDEAVNIIDKNKCLAVCVGKTLSEKSDDVIKQIATMKQRIEVPLLFPLIAFQSDEIEANCKEKGIVL